MVHWGLKSNNMFEMAIFKDFWVGVRCSVGSGGGVVTLNMTIRPLSINVVDEVEVESNRGRSDSCCSSVGVGSSNGDDEVESLVLGEVLLRPSEGSRIREEMRGWRGMGAPMDIDIDIARPVRDTVGSS